MSEPDERGAGQESMTGRLSDDGHLVWDGRQWQAVTGHLWRPTGWTRPMQLAAGAYFVFVSLIGTAASLLFHGQIRDAAVRQLQASNPAITPEAAQQAAAFGTSVGLGAALVFTVLFVILGVLSVVRRWTWTFYADLVLLGLSSLGLIGTLPNLFNPSAGNPPVLTMINLVSGLAALALFGWMLAARIQRGVWACRRVPTTA